jgi:hypothetical protein
VLLGPLGTPFGATVCTTLFEVSYLTSVVGRLAPAAGAGPITLVKLPRLPPIDMPVSSTSLQYVVALPRASISEFRKPFASYAYCSVAVSFALSVGAKVVWVRKPDAASYVSLGQGLG